MIDLFESLIEISQELAEANAKEYRMDAPDSIKKAIEGGKAKILKTAPSYLGGKSVFAVIENPLAKGTQHDPVVMAIISDPSRGKIKLFRYFGSHPSPTGAMKFAKNNDLLESVELDEKVSDMQYMMDSYWNYFVDYRASRHGGGFSRHAADKPFWQKMVKFYYEGRKKEAERIDSDYGFNQDVYEGIVDKKLPKTPMSYWVAVDGHDRYAKRYNLAESIELDEKMKYDPKAYYLLLKGKIYGPYRNSDKALQDSDGEGKVKLGTELTSKEKMKLESVELDEISPPGWEGTVKAMKKKKGDEKIDNPWALAWWMKGKGYKSHYTKDGTKKK